MSTNKSFSQSLDEAIAHGAILGKLERQHAAECVAKAWKDASEITEALQRVSQQFREGDMEFNHVSDFVTGSAVIECPPRIINIARTGRGTITVTDSLCVVDIASVDPVDEGPVKRAVRRHANISSPPEIPSDHYLRTREERQEAAVRISEKVAFVAAKRGISLARDLDCV